MTHPSLRWLDRWIGQKQARKARRVLSFMVMLVLPVMLLLSLLAAWQMRDSNRQAFEARMAELARTTAQTLDASLAAYLSAASVLAMASDLQPGGTPGAIYAQAWQVGESLGGWVIVSSTEPGRPQLVNTILSEPSLPRSFAAGAVKRSDSVLLGLKPAVSGLFDSSVIGRPIIMVSAPVLHDGAARAVVSIVIEPRQLATVLSALRLPEGVVAGISDGQSRILARSSDGDRYVGQLGRTWPEQPGAVDVPVVERTGLTGEPTLYAVRSLTSAPSWHVVVGVPVSQAAALVTAPLQWMLFTRVFMAGLVVLGALLAWLGWRESRRSYRELDRVLANVPAIIGINRVWPDGRFSREFLSRSAVQVTGWSWDELVEMGTFSGLMEATAVAGLQQHLMMVLRDDQSTYEYQLRGGDGARRWIHTTGAVIERFKDGSALVVSCMIDVSDTHATRQRMRLLERLAVLGEVSSSIAHELNQPLAAITMAAENGARALERDPPRLQTARDKFTRIREQAHRISAVIDHVRSFSRDDADKAETLNIGAVVHEALVLLEARLDGAGIELDIDVPPGLPLVRGVGVLLEQAALNLIANACDAYRDRPEFTRRIIHITARRHGDEMRLSIADAAGGIEDAVMQRIFDPFFTTKPVGKGTGLGLSISLASVVDMGGTLTVRNEGGGACFTITLPMVDCGSPSAADAVAA